MSLRPSSAPVTSQRDLFLKAIRALLGPLVAALAEGELLDPGLLLAYTRIDPKYLGLDGSDLGDVYDAGGGAPVGGSRMLVKRRSLETICLAMTWQSMQHTRHEGLHGAHIVRTGMSRYDTHQQPPRKCCTRHYHFYDNTIHTHPQCWQIEEMCRECGSGPVRVRTTHTDRRELADGSMCDRVIDSTLKGMIWKLGRDAQFMQRPLMDFADLKIRNWRARVPFSSI